MKRIIFLYLLFNVASNYCKTPLMIAAEQRDYNMMEQLIAKGANVNEHEYIDFFRIGKTALCIAVDNNDEKAAGLLLEAGAHVNILFSNEVGTTIVEKLDEKIAVFRNASLLCYAICKHTSKDIINLLIDYDAKIDAPVGTNYNDMRGWYDNFGKKEDTFVIKKEYNNVLPPLMIALICGNKTAIKILIEREVRLDTTCIWNTKDRSTHNYTAKSLAERFNLSGSLPE